MATDEIITRYKIELDQLKAEVSQLTTQFTKIDDAADKSGKKVKKSFDDSAKAGTKFSSALSGIATGIVAAFSVQQVLAFAKRSIDGFVAAEKQAEKLKFAVISLGKEGEVAFQKLINQSKQLSASNGGSLFGAGQIQEAQAMLVQFGLTTKEAEKLTPAVLDLAAATGGDLNGAVSKVTNALKGQTKGLKIVGADFKATGDFTKDYNKLLEEMAKLSGTAAASTDTATGALRRQEEAMNDITDSLGERWLPILTKLRSFGLDVAQAGTLAVEDLGKLLGLITGGGTGSGATEESLRKKGKDAQAAFVEGFVSEFKGLSLTQLEDKLDSSIRLYNESLAEVRKFEAEGNGIAAVGARQRQLQYAAQRDALRLLMGDENLRGENETKILSDLSKLNSKQLQIYIDGLKERGDVTRQTTQSAIELAEEQLTKTAAAEQKAIEDAQKRRADAQKALFDLEAGYAEKRKEALAKDELDLIRIKKDAALKQAQDQFNLAGGASNPAAVSSFEKTKADIEVIFAKETADKKVEIAKEAADEMDKILDDLTKENEKLVNIDYANFKKGQDDKVKAAEEAAERIKQAQEEAINNSIALVGTLFDIEQNLRSQRIADLEYQREQDREYADEKQVELQDDLDNRLITQAQYENELTKLKKDRVAAEKAIQAKINAEKSKADKADRIRALFEIAINTAIGIVKTGAQLGYPAAIPFVALIAALGIAQTAAVASQPLPKYAEGTRYLDRNGNKRGKDTIAIMADEGERIIPRKQNVRHWKLYNAIDDGSFDKLIHDTYVLPALVAAQKKNQKHKQETFAENIAKSFIASATSKGTEFYDLQRLWNRGIKVTNLDDIISDDIKSPYR